MKIFNKNIDKVNLLKKVGDITQLGGIKYYELIDGVSRGVRAIDIHTLCGIDMTILADRGMDISQLSFKNIPISWKSATKETSPMYYESWEDEIARTFYGGLFITCGLTQMGSACNDNGEELGLHGRISNISAEKISIEEFWDENDYVYEVSGKVRESRIFGDKLEMSRSISTWMNKPKIIIEDIIENIGFKTSPLMILYHVNIGYPLLDKDSELILPKNSIVIPRDEDAKKGLADYRNFSDPIDDFKQQVFFHDIYPDKEDKVNVLFLNNTLGSEGLGLLLKCNKKNLPYLIQCKQMGGGEYFCEIGPANSFVRGRKIEKENNNVRFINPGEKVINKIEFELLDSSYQIDNEKNRITSL